MFKKIIFSLFLLLIMVTFALPVLAATGDFGLGDTAINAGYQATEKNTVANVAQTVIGIVLQFLAIVFFIVIVYAGLRWMTARGNDEYAKRATHALQAGIIGIIITVSAYGISSFVFDRLSGGATGTQDCGSVNGHCVDVDQGCTSNEFQYGGASACPASNPNRAQVCCTLENPSIKTINCCVRRYVNGSKLECTPNDLPADCVSFPGNYDALFYDNTICGNLDMCK